MKKIAIIGAGTYGSYLAHAISEKYQNIEINLFEVGDENIKSESEIGYKSSLVKSRYNATTEGRFFGLGGTSARWGGQLLFFSEKDFSEKSGMEILVEANLKYRDTVLKRFFKKVPILKEEFIESRLFKKSGVWLKFNQRNLYQYFNLDKNPKIKVFKNSRLVKINKKGVAVESILVERNQKIEEHSADIYYLTAGAFESLRIMGESSLTNIEMSSLGFSDHISMRAFKVLSSKTDLGDIDFQFRFQNGSMITNRLVGETDSKVSYFVHPIFNEDFTLFQFLKEFIYKRRFSISKLFSISTQFFSIFPFIYSYLVKKKLFVYKSWYLNIDIELINSSNIVSVSKEMDLYKQAGINISYQITQETQDHLIEIKKKIKGWLIDKKVSFIEVAENNTTSLKLEDTYHPYRLFCYNKNIDISELYHPLSNLYMFNTGLLCRSGGINPTASLFCFIEKHLEDLSKNNSF